MKKKMYMMMTGFVLVVLLAACGKAAAEPRAINEETDKCEVCNMSVMDNEFATQLLTEKGKTLVFDDIGCMYGWMKDNDGEAVEASFVRDYNSEEWINTEDAFYVFDEDVKTPMAYNMISFEKKADAEKYIDENAGELLNADELKKHKWVMNHNMMEGHDESGDHEHDMDSEDGHSDEHDMNAEEGEGHSH
ncbi:nitrous oxide reductase accessory protein NosL [Rossellomorea marisflavi]|uniref:nitrous oxide reductase accessory protein NosL n=1 Tax=Rossellomorea marisflavi TaxID=189381 RepID=UPI00279D2239|nr:nitrous oxide reductase accessory protein NosL [Rossellomorea marisflavi]UTE72206.1 nitrous oxide reductase accessory protein NosL [Rossellomorea marisflavi]